MANKSSKRTNGKKNLRVVNKEQAQLFVSFEVKGDKRLIQDLYDNSQERDLKNEFLEELRDFGHIELVDVEVIMK